MGGDLWEKAKMAFGLGLGVFTFFLEFKQIKAPKKILKT